MSGECCCERQHLTPGEVRVVEGIARGLTNDRIGVALGLSGLTVATHVSNAMRRLNVRSRAELVARCYFLSVLDGVSWPPEHTGRRCIGEG